MEVNQRTIADRLNVSTATVSKSLRNSPDIHPQTRAQVIELANKLGYRPTSLRMYKEAKTQKKEMLSIGLLIQSDARLGTGSKVLQNAMLVLAGISEACYAANASVTVHYVPLKDVARISDREFQPVAMREGHLAGVVLQHYFPPEVTAAIARQIPCVTLIHNYPGLRVDCIDVDCSQAMALVVDHVYQLGHRRIGFLGGLVGQSWNDARFAGYIQSLARLGLPIDETIADRSLDSFHEDPAMIQRVAELTRSGVTAWVTSNDIVARLWCRRLAQAGLRVPQDVSITGIDAVGTPENDVAVTSVRVPFEEMGQAATLRLIDRIREPASSIRRICFEGQFVEGETTAPPRTL